MNVRLEGIIPVSKSHPVLIASVAATSDIRSVVMGGWPGRSVAPVRLRNDGKNLITVSVTQEYTDTTLRLIRPDRSKPELQIVLLATGRNCQSLGVPADELQVVVFVPTQHLLGRVQVELKEAPVPLPKQLLPYGLPAHLQAHRTRDRRRH